MKEEGGFVKNENNWVFQIETFNTNGLLGKPSWKKKCFLLGIAQITSPPPSPQFGQLVPLFLDVKNDILARITEWSKDDCDNDVSDNCDHNFGTFDDFGV